MEELIEAIKKIEPLSLPNTEMPAVWLEDVIQVIIEHYENKAEE